MSDSIESMENKGVGHGGLGGKFGSKWQAGESGNKHGRVKWHTEKRGSGVAARQCVESAGHGHTCDSVKGRQDHGDLWRVNGQVWGDRAVFPLVHKEFLFLIMRDLHGRCGRRSKRAKTNGSERESGEC